MTTDGTDIKKLYFSNNEELFESLSSQAKLNLQIHNSLREIATKIVFFLIGVVFIEDDDYHHGFDAHENGTKADELKEDKDDSQKSLGNDNCNQPDRLEEKKTCASTKTENAINKPNHHTTRLHFQNANVILEQLYGEQRTTLDKDDNTKQFFLLVKLFKKLLLQCLNKPDCTINIDEYYGTWESSGTTNSDDDRKSTNRRLKYFLSFDDFFHGILNTNRHNDLVLLTNDLSYRDFLHYMVYNESPNPQPISKRTTLPRDELDIQNIKDFVETTLISLPLQYELLISIQRINLCVYLLSVFGFFPSSMSFVDDFFLEVLGGSSEVNSVEKPENRSFYASSLEDYSMNDDYFSTFFDSDLMSSTNDFPSVKSITQSGFTPFFRAQLNRLSRQHVVLYLELKTQAYISYIQHELSKTNDASTNVIPKQLIETTLENVFDQNKMKAYLQTRKKSHPNEQEEITIIEQDFLNRCSNRKQHLQKFTNLQKLVQTYTWGDFMLSFVKFAQKRLRFFDNRLKQTPKIQLTNSIPTTPMDLHSLPSTPGSTVSTAPSGRSTPSVHPSESHLNAETAITEETLTADTAQLSDTVNGHSIQAPSKPVRKPLVAKPKRKTAWTSEEEDALLNALKVCGPKWTTILDLFGAGGQLSESLKNRAPVQLKDKARNWKMFFLKTEIPVPPYLEKVTGGIERSTTGGNKGKVMKPKRKLIKKTTIRMDLNKFKYNPTDMKLSEQLQQNYDISSFIRENKIDTEEYNTILDLHNPLLEKNLNASP
ncbi:hypothetical protein ACO0QE_002426 [Hanseniaspora vineae]